MPVLLEPISEIPGQLPTELRNGDRLTQPEFHELYSAMPEHIRAELIEGIVYMASPLKSRHGNRHGWFTTAMTYFEGHTPGVEAYDNATLVLDNTEVQPDSLVRILPEFGGRTEDTSDGFISGTPELVCEVSDSTRSLDLGRKKRAYVTGGVLEYLVLNLRDQKLHWFDLANDRELTIPEDGIVKVNAFPGLWIDSKALLARDIRGMLATLDSGLASPEHGEFVAKLASQKRPPE